MLADLKVCTTECKSIKFSMTNQNENTQTPVQYLKGVGPKLAKVLAKINIQTIEDLLYYLPREYEDRTKIKAINALAPGENYLIKGRIMDIQSRTTQSRFSILKVLITDASGSIETVFFNQPFLANLLRRGMFLYLNGKVEYSSFEKGLQFMVKSFEIDNGEALKFIPVYPLTQGLYPKKMRSLVAAALRDHLGSIEEIIPAKIIKSYRLLPVQDAIKRSHFPDDLSQVSPAQRTLVFEEFFVFLIGVYLRKKQVQKSVGFKFNVEKDKIEAFKQTLPFSLTNSQNKVLLEIIHDLSQPHPMNRLLQGDVGCGKTVVAAIAALIAHQNNFATAIMAPTEILAQQHFQKIKELLGGMGLNILLLTGSTSKQNTDLGNVDILIGTHALIQGSVLIERLGLVIIDEQHRFGVEQRALLSAKGKNPHILVMTATPIPRSLALTVYGELDHSIINEMPKGRISAQTHFVPEEKRESAYNFIRQKIKENQQVFIVCPLVEESEKIDLKAAKETQAHLQVQVFPEYKVALLHGKMKAQEKERIMQDFKDNKIQILVSTTVIEVGIDIPNATILMLEHAERFGLSQMHQLRGRIGRGDKPSYFFMIGNPKSNDARQRVKAMLDSNDGFKIAEIDLKLRGPGDLFGLRQSGLPNFRVADIIRDENTLNEAREAAMNLILEDVSCARNIWNSKKQKIKSPVAGKTLN